VNAGATTAAFTVWWNNNNGGTNLTAGQTYLLNIICIGK